MRYNKEIDYAKIGKRIKMKREQLHISQDKASEKVDITAKYWSNIEANNTPTVGFSALYNIANALDTNIDYFISDSINDNLNVVYEEVYQMLKAMSPDQRTLAMDLVKLVFDNEDKFNHELDAEDRK